MPKWSVCREKADAVTFVPNAGSDAGVPCVVTDLKPANEQKNKKKAVNASRGTIMNNYILDPQDGQMVSRYRGYDMALSPIKPANGWAKAPRRSQRIHPTFGQGTGEKTRAGFKK